MCSASTGVLGLKTVLATFACSRQQAFHQRRTAHLSRGGQANWHCVRGCAYLARFQTTVAVPPPDAAGTVYVSSSPVRVKDRFCSIPSQLGNVEVSILKVMVLSAALTDKVPK